MRIYHLSAKELSTVLENCPWVYKEYTLLSQDYRSKMSASSRIGTPSIGLGVVVIVIVETSIV